MVDVEEEIELNLLWLVVSDFDIFVEKFLMY